MGGRFEWSQPFPIYIEKRFFKEITHFDVLQFQATLWLGGNKKVGNGGTLCQDNCQLIGMSLIGLARQVQKNRD